MGRRRNIATGEDSTVSPLPILTACQWNSIVRLLGFSPQQAKIVGLILQGKRDKQIAGHLGLSESTVRTHLRHVFARLNVTDRVELVLHVWSVSNGHNRQSTIVGID